MPECKKSRNLKNCTCTYKGCARKGICCECIAHHREAGEIPGCLFSAAAERSYDRSAEKFISGAQARR